LEDDDGEIDDEGEVVEDGEVDEGEERHGSKVAEVAKPQDPLEDGEVDDDEESPYLKNYNRSVCKFFSKGQCTWGSNCR
jgi:hypothetical protein